MKFNYQIIIEYLGKNFSGWQIQKNSISVQSKIERALSKTLNSKIKVIGSGRTDAGVNAWGQSANFYHKEEIKNFFKFLSTVNFFLSKYSVSILSLKKKNLTFHARYSAKKREYEYVILNRAAKPSVDDNRVWLVKKKLNLDEMKKAAKYFIGKHNFSAFRSSSCTAKSPIRTINNLKITKRGDKIIIKILSKSFLQKQVRSMVGCLKFVGENKWNALKIKKVILSKQRKIALRQLQHKVYF